MQAFSACFMKFCLALNSNKIYKGKMTGRQRKVSAGIKEKVQDGERQEKENRRRRSDKKDAGKERAWE